MNNQEHFFARCSFCLKDNQMIVFDLEWKGQKSTTSNQWVARGKVWLCSPCCKDYHQEWDNEDYNKEVDEMCEVLNARQ